MKKFFIYCLSVVLGLLVYWLIGFVLDDTARPPVFEGQYTVNQLNHQIDQLQRQINDTQSQQAILKSNMQNTQSIINQIVDMQKGKPASQELVNTFQKNTALFLTQQNELQALNQKLLQLNTNVLPLQNQRDAINAAIDNQYQQYRFNIGLWQVSGLLILLFLAGFVAKKRSHSPYRLIWWAINISVLFKIFFVIHDYFPSRYFKYILILALIIVVWMALRRLIKSQLMPTKKQLKLAYAKFLCGVCEFPIRRKDREAYVCPSCGTDLFDECSACGNIKHNLLPYCEHCGNQTA